MSAPSSCIWRYHQQYTPMKCLVWQLRRPWNYVHAVNQLWGTPALASGVLLLRYLILILIESMDLLNQTVRYMSILPSILSIAIGKKTKWKSYCSKFIHWKTNSTETMMTILFQYLVYLCIAVIETGWFSESFESIKLNKPAKTFRTCEYRVSELCCFMMQWSMVRRFSGGMAH